MEAMCLRNEGGRLTKKKKFQRVAASDDRISHVQNLRAKISGQTTSVLELPPISQRRAVPFHQESEESATMSFFAKRQVAGSSTSAAAAAAAAAQKPWIEK